LLLSHPLIHNIKHFPNPYSSLPLSLLHPYLLPSFVPLPATIPYLGQRIVYIILVPFQ
jgi:hypothetical protein